MSHPSQVRRRALGLGAVAATAALVVGSAASAHARPDTARLDLSETQGTGATAAALAQENGVSIAAAREQLRTERSHDKLADRLTRELGKQKTAGAYIAESGALVVNVTNRSAAQYVRSEGARAERVDHSSARLNAVHRALDTFAQNAGAGAGVQSWYVDVRDNNVVVTASKGASGAATKAFLAKARSFGDLVEVERTSAKAMTTAYLYGGQQIAMSSGGVCSNGFNATTSTGASILLTAGHCAEGYPTFSRNGVTIGSTRGYSFPTNDYASVNINDPSYWNPQPGVDMYNGYARIVYGYSSAPVGSSVCKSGRTTGWTCGTIQAYNQTVNYGGGDIVYGLVRHSACVEQGDSGGSNMSGNYAQGLTSGAGLYSSGGKLVCGEKVGQPNSSYYQPVGEALSAYGATLVTQ